ncbi:MAG TPA: SpoIIE family protein phosphatase [bacterium]|nr:SpoIIE family protein phosphatase [bacterium]
MIESAGSPLRDQLLNRRSNLERALATSPSEPQLQKLLAEVDAALDRTSKGTYGLCDVCNEPIEPDRLMADPLVRFCLGHMTPSQQEALEQDLDLAAQIQSALLPERHFRRGGWEAAYHYEGAGPISGDYCDLVSSGEDLYFIVGDVSGKGVAASMLMAHLHATFQALAPLRIPLSEIMERASRMLCESTLPTYFATLVCGKAHRNGEVEMSNAGHNPPLLVQGSNVVPVEATGLPLGMFCEEHFSVSKVKLAAGDTIITYTDGLSEAVDASGAQYGTDRLLRIAKEHHSLPPMDLISACVKDLSEFESGVPKSDDLTIMVVRRLGDDRS